MQSTKHKADMLDQTLWGRNFQRDEIERIARHLIIREIKEGETVFSEGERQDYLAFLIAGRVEITKHGEDNTEAIVIRLSPGAHFGELSFIDGFPRSASATTLEHCTLLILKRDEFQNISRDYPKIALRMLHNVCRMISARLRRTTGQYVYLKGNDDTGRPIKL